MALVAFGIAFVVQKRNLNVLVPAYAGMDAILLLHMYSG